MSDSRINFLYLELLQFLCFSNALNEKIKSSPTMKTKVFFSLVISLIMTLPVMAGTIVLEGNYMGKNIFVKNPFGGAGVGFCVFEVTVNGKLSPDEVNQSAFEIDFGNHDLKLGDKVIINIKHKDDCSPQVLNPEVLRPKSTFKTEKIAFNSEGVLEWTTSNETGKLNYIVEQYRWNKWVKVGEVMGDGKPGTHNYSFKIEPHSGENRARVKQVDVSGKPRYSTPATYTSNAPSIKLDGEKFKDVINFSGGETLYELYDRYGTIVKKGYGSSVKVDNLEKGTYYVSYDNETKTIQLR